MEHDPRGLKPNEPGAKLDAGKLRVFSILREFPRAIAAVCDVGTYGASKYSLGGWTTVSNGIERYGDAEGRHLLKQWEGETLDPSSGLEHAAHRLWNALAAYELELRERENKQREKQREEATATSSTQTTVGVPWANRVGHTVEFTWPNGGRCLAVYQGNGVYTVSDRVQEPGTSKSVGELEAVQDELYKRHWYSSVSGCEKKPPRTSGCG